MSPEASAQPSDTVVKLVEKMEDAWLSDDASQFAEMLSETAQQADRIGLPPRVSAIVQRHLEEALIRVFAEHELGGP